MSGLQKPECSVLVTFDNGRFVGVFGCHRLSRCVLHGQSPSPRAPVYLKGKLETARNSSITSVKDIQRKLTQTSICLSYSGRAPDSLVVGPSKRRFVLSRMRQAASRLSQSEYELVLEATGLSHYHRCPTLSCTHQCERHLTAELLH